MSRRALEWALAAAAASLYIAMQVAPLLGTRGSGVAGMASHANDFKHIYLGAVLMREGLSPFDPRVMMGAAADRARTEDPRFRTILPYVYPPTTAVMMRPVAALPFAHAVVAWQLANHVMLIAALALLARAAPEGRRLLTLGAALAVAAFYAPLFRQNSAGQLNVALLLAYAGVAELLRRNARDEATGATIAAAALFKATPALLLPWALVHRRWRLAAAISAFAAGGIALSLLLAPPGAWLGFARELPAMGYGRSTWAEFGQTFWRDPYNQSINALLHRTLVPHKGSDVVPWGLKVSPAGANALTWGASLAILVLTFTGTRRAASPPDSLPLAIMASLLLPSLMWDHYLVQMAAPVMLLWWRVGVAGRAVLAASVVVAALPVALDQEAFRSGAGLLLMSLKLWPALAVFGVAYAATASRAESAP